MSLTLESFDALAADEKALWLADWEMNREECPHCGHPRSECSDPDREWYPVHDVCHAVMVQRMAEWKYDELHHDRPYHDGSFEKWSTERSRKTPFHYRDGVTITVSARDLTPDDDFLAPPSLAPTQEPLA